MQQLTNKEKKRSNQQFPVNLSWQFVFNGLGDVKTCVADAIAAGYEYLAWSNRVYYIGTDSSEFETGIVIHKDKFIYDLNWLCEYWIGRNVVKVSGKPFKSGKHVATVKGILGQNPLSKEPSWNKPVFTFEEDESVVECLKCIQI